MFHCLKASIAIDTIILLFKNCFISIIKYGIFLGVLCPKLPDIRNGQYNNDNCNNPRKQRRYEDACEIVCNEGYTSSGITLHCAADRKWVNRDKLGACERKSQQVVIWIYKTAVAAIYYFIK